MVERRYWDSDCFLGWLQDEPGKADVLNTFDKALIGKSRRTGDSLAIAEPSVPEPELDLE